MKVKVDKYIQELLFENEAVNIPGLGGLVTDYQPAEIDHIQAKILPPAREVSLNTNLHTNDGLLTQRIADDFEISGLEAEQIIQDYVEQIHETLNAGEIVTIEGVGRVYKNLQGALQLLTDHTNFDTSVYGLPAVSSTLIKRAQVPSSPSPAQRNGANAKTQSPSSALAGLTNWFQNNLWIVVSAAMVVFIFSLWLLFFKNDTSDPGSGLSEVKELPESRINVSPGDEVEDDELIMGEEVPGNLEEDTEQPTEDTPIPPADIKAEDESEDLNTEAPTIAPEQNIALIRIGIFGDRANVQRLVQRIYDEGFEPYTREKGKLIEVGVQFAYDDEQEIRTNLRAIRKKFEKKAKVVR